MCEFFQSGLQSVQFERHSGNMNVGMSTFSACGAHKKKRTPCIESDLNDMIGQCALQENHNVVQSDVSGSQYSLYLHIHRMTRGGLTNVHRLDLVAVQDVCMLQSMFQNLLNSAFPNGLPFYLTSDEYYLFTPREHFAPLPDDIISTQFRLVAAVDGWETVVAVRDLQDMSLPGQERKMMVTMAEFDSNPIASEDGTSKTVVSVVSYPSISIEKEFLDTAIRNLSREHKQFYSSSTFRL